MASKGKDKTKDKIKPKKDEIWFDGKLVDAKRFAYDVVKYTAMKFGLPEYFISVWEGSDNDYGCDDFCLVVTREIIRYQIVARCQCLVSFDRRNRLNGLASFDVIGKLLQDVMYDEMAGPQYDILDKVEISLSVLGELVLYLYTKDVYLHLKQLIDHWFDYLNIDKKSFEDAGGLTKLYDRNRVPKFDDFDHFHDLFIKSYCLSYKETASNPEIMVMYSRSYGSRMQKNAESLPPKDSKDIKKESMRDGERAMRHSERNGCKVACEIKEEAIPEPDETARIDSVVKTRVKQHENIRFRIQKQNEKHGDKGPLGAVVPPSHNLPESNNEEFQNGRRLSAKVKMRLEKAGDRPSLGQCLGILEHHELYAVGGHSAFVVPPSQDLHEASSGGQPSHGRRLSAREKKQTRKDTVFQSLEEAQGLPEVQPRHSRRPSAKERMEMTRAGVRPSLEESFGELSLDSSKLKLSMKKRATRLAIDDKKRK